MWNFRFGHMQKAGIVAAIAAVAVLFGGCGKSGNYLGGTADDRYNDSVYGAGVYGADTYAGGGTAYWDGYGINGTNGLGNGFSGTADNAGLGSLSGTAASVMD